MTIKCGLHRDIHGSSMFNGPCQLHGSAGFISAADEALLTPTGYVNAGVTGIPLPHGLRPPPPPPHMSDPPCSADHCLMNPGLTCPDVYMALEGVQFLAEHTRREQYTIRVRILDAGSLSYNFSSMLSIAIVGYRSVPSTGLLLPRLPPRSFSFYWWRISWSESKEFSLFASGTTKRLLVMRLVVWCGFSLSFLLSDAGPRGLEVRGHGFGSTLLVDLHDGRPAGHGGHYPASAHFVWRSHSDRYQAFRNCCRSTGQRSRRGQQHSSYRLNDSFSSILFSSLFFIFPPSAYECGLCVCAGAWASNRRASTVLPLSLHLLLLATNMFQ